MQAVFQAGAWVISKASPAPTLADHRVTSSGGKPTGTGCAGAAWLPRSRCSEGCCVGAGCLVRWQTRAQIRGNVVKPQPRDGGRHHELLSVASSHRVRGPRCSHRRSRVSLPACQLFYGVQLPDAVGRKGERLFDACLSLSGSAVPKSLPQAPVQQPVILVILPLRGQR